MTAFRRSPSSSSSWLFAVLLLGPHLLGCGDDEKASGPVRPPGPPELTIEALRPAGAPVWHPGDDPSCVDIGRDPARTIAVELGETTPDRLRLVNWTFRAFDGCEGAPQCGPVVVTVTQGEKSVQVPGISVSVAVPFRDLELGEGTTTFKAELLNDDGTPYLLDGGVAASAEVVVDVSERCTPVPDGGLPDGGADATVPDGAVLDAAADADAAGPLDASRDAAADGAVDASGIPADASGTSDASVDATLDAMSDAPTGG